nr:MAG TPA: hypothetical protein [Caudoviricetes sp.]
MPIVTNCQYLIQYFLYLFNKLLTFKTKKYIIIIGGDLYGY